MVSAWTKSSPLSRNARTGAGMSEVARPSTSRTDFPVRSGFCSEPESANSLPMIVWVRMNHEWSWPVFLRWASVPRVSKPGKSGGGSRLPSASNHIELGPGRMRMACCGQTGSQLWMPST